jgi:hypothetical protein
MCKYMDTRTEQAIEDAYQDRIDYLFEAGAGHKQLVSVGPGTTKFSNSAGIYQRRNWQKLRKLGLGAVLSVLKMFRASSWRTT